MFLISLVWTAILKIILIVRPETLCSHTHHPVRTLQSIFYAQIPGGKQKSPQRGKPSSLQLLTSNQTLSIVGRLCGTISSIWANSSANRGNVPFCCTRIRTQSPSLWLTSSCPNLKYAVYPGLVFAKKSRICWRVEPLRTVSISRKTIPREKTSFALSSSLEVCCTSGGAYSLYSSVSRSSRDRLRVDRPDIPVLYTRIHSCWMLDM